MAETTVAVAVIADISRSRSHADRRSLQDAVTAAFARTDELVAAVQPLEPTVGDEFQAVYSDLRVALRATLLARLQLPSGIDCRFGLGLGEVYAVGTGRIGAIQDGSAWWSARTAVEEARRNEYSRLGFVRTWFHADPAGGRSPDAGLVNAYLLLRDQVVTGMSERSRRLLLGQLLDETQEQLAKHEGITQSAVSQNLSRSGATALLASEALILGGTA
jgi:hypothetical protein